MTQEENEKLMYSSPEDQCFYLKGVEGLPTLAGLNGTGKDENGVPLPYGTGPHSVRCLREIVSIVHPQNIIEIGFNMGYSSAMWLELAPEAKVFSCDISYKKETIVAAEILSERYDGRFRYMNRGDVLFFSYLNENDFDLIFIDGGHELKDVVADLEFALNLKIPNIAMDDFLPEFGEIQKAIEQLGEKVEIVNVNGNIALLKN